MSPSSLKLLPVLANAPRKAVQAPDTVSRGIHP
jgi:hypothetical protein